MKFYRDLHPSNEDLIGKFDGLGDVSEIELLKKYTGGQIVNVDKTTGLVFAQSRRKSNEIANEWSNKVYKNKEVTEKEYQYTGLIPIMKSRHLFVVDTLNNSIPGGLSGKSICDIGAGEGYFLDLAKNIYNANVFGVEPSTQNCSYLKDKGIKFFNGTAEDYFLKDSVQGTFDIVSLNWTLCNCSNCNRIMEIAFQILNEDGYLVVSDSSRLLTPFKKSLSLYFEPSLSLDLHAWFFSFNTIRCLMALHGFMPIFQNNHHEQNDLITIASKKINDINTLGPEAYFDDYRKVISFFERWEKESQNYKYRDRGGYNLLSK